MDILTRGGMRKFPGFFRWKLRLLVAALGGVNFFYGHNYEICTTEEGFFAVIFVSYAENFH